SVRRLSALPSVALGALVLGCAVMARQTPEYAGMLTWTSRALPEARGDFRVLPDGRREAIRYKGWTTRDFSAFRTYDYDDPRPEPVVERVTMPAGLKGDPTKGRALFLDRAKGPCSGCHPGGPERAMRSVATRYPKHVRIYGRVMSLEDFLEAHGPETTGRPYPAESADNLTMTMRIKMASNGLAVALDTSSPEARAAIARGRATFYRKVGARNHSCADCHTSDKGAKKFLGGRLLA